MRIYLSLCFTLSYLCTFGETCKSYVVNSTNETFVAKIPNKLEEIWILPSTNFELLFALDIDNLMTLHPSYLTKQKLVITPAMINNSSNTWIRLDLRVFKKEIDLGQDKIAIQASILNQNHTFKTNFWWRQYSVENVVLSAVGNVEIAVGCEPNLRMWQTTLTEMPPETSNSLRIIIFSIVVTVIIIVLVITMVSIYKWKQKVTYKWPSNELPEPSRGFNNKVLDSEFKNNCDNIYEEVDREDSQKPRIPKPYINVEKHYTEADILHQSCQWKFSESYGNLANISDVGVTSQGKVKTLNDRLYVDMSGNHSGYSSIDIEDD